MREIHCKINASRMKYKKKINKFSFLFLRRSLIYPKLDDISTINRLNAELFGSLGVIIIEKSSSGEPLELSKNHLFTQIYYRFIVEKWQLLEQS